MADGKVSQATLNSGLEITEKQIDEQIAVWKELTGRNNNFKLNDNEEIVRALAKGVLNNEKKHGLKFCPCRMRTKNRVKDLKIICPCNFKAQATWQEKEECWCSLFVKNYTYFKHTFLYPNYLLKI